MLRELMERAEEVLNTFAAVEREARALADGLVAEADLDSQTKQFLAESYEPVEPIVFARNIRKADRVAYLKCVPLALVRKTSLSLCTLSMRAIA